MYPVKEDRTIGSLLAQEIATDLSGSEGPVAEPVRAKIVQILGTRGIPAQHGGFETFAQQLAEFLVSRGWEVTVYCQLPDGDHRVCEDEWRGIRRIHIPGGSSAKGTAAFDFRSTIRSLKEPGVPLILGYNTAVFSVLFRLLGRKSVMNMDGIEWRRDKWPPAYKAWLWMNEYCGAHLSTRLVADHPEIKRHLMRHTRASKIVVIPYSAAIPKQCGIDVLTRLGVCSDDYFLVIARPEPENSILEIVRAFSRTSRGIKLVVLGNLSPESNHYHAEIIGSASPECIFPGAIYGPENVAALRLNARAYVHGHTVGGTNPSLVEALACGSAVIARDNPFNRWVAGDAGVYFTDEDQLDQWFYVLADRSTLIQQLRVKAKKRYMQEFTAEKVLGKYEEVLMSTLTSQTGQVDLKNAGVIHANF